MEFLIPLIVILLMVLVPVGFLLARGSGRGPIRGGPHPDDIPGRRE